MAPQIPDNNNNDQEELVADAGQQIRFAVIEKTLDDRFGRLFTGYDQGLVRGDRGRLVITPTFATHAHKIANMAPRADDVWLVTFPKCGIIAYNFLIKFA